MRATRARAARWRRSRLAADRERSFREPDARETLTEGVVHEAVVHGPAPIQPDQEWANATTHGLAAIATLVLGGMLTTAALNHSVALAISCVAYAASVFGTFLASTLSHTFLTQPRLNTFRAWDQAMIFAMIVGTYTPIAAFYAPPSVAVWLIVGMWSAAGWGMFRKVVHRHRVNNISPWPFLFLGWAPAAVLYFYTPSWVCLTMLAGGIGFMVGVVFLMNDTKHRYWHAIWHLCVMTAAAIQYAGIWKFVTG